MSQKNIVMMGLFIGSSVGSSIPFLFGGSLFSSISIISGAVGGAAGVYIAYKLS